MAIDEQAYHEQLDAAASEALAELLSIAKSQGIGAQIRADAAKAILNLHLAYHGGTEIEVDETGVAPE